MILVRLTGGLGNQMFQYALGTHLAIKNNAALKVDTSLLMDRSRPNEIITHRDLSLDIFDLKLDIATQNEVWYFNGRPYDNIFGKILNKFLWQFRKYNLVVEKKREFEPAILELTDNKCLVGAWQSEKYFKSSEAEVRRQYKFRQELSGPSAELGRNIREVNSVCVNVRRGDYVTSPIYSKNIGALSAVYYNAGIKMLEQKFPDAKLFVFSDDVDWCRNNIVCALPVTFVGHEHAGEKFDSYLQLMSFCRHFIISNSTFSWWGAWLGEKRGSVIVAPETWAREAASDPNDIIPDRWLKLKNTFEDL